QKLPDRMSLARRDDIVIRLVLLKHQPHGTDKIRSVAPIAFCLEISKKQLVLYAQLDSGDGLGDFSSDKSLSTARRLMIEQYSVTGKETMPFPVIYRHPMGVEFGRRIGAAGLKACRLVLRRRCRTEHLTARCVVKLCLHS